MSRGACASLTLSLFIYIYIYIYNALIHALLPDCIAITFGRVSNPKLNCAYLGSGI